MAPGGHDDLVGKHRSSRSARWLSGVALAALVSLVAVAALVGSVAATAAAPSIRRAAAPTLAYRLEARLAPVGASVGSGEFTALLVRIAPRPLGEPGVRPPLSAAELPPGCGLISSPPGSTIPDRIKCGTEPAFPIPTLGLHWVLFWRLTHTH